MHSGVALSGAASSLLGWERRQASVGWCDGGAIFGGKADTIECCGLGDWQNLIVLRPSHDFCERGRLVA